VENVISFTGTCVRPAGFVTAARASSATARNAPPIPAEREPTVAGEKRQPAKTGSVVCADGRRRGARESHATHSDPR
jgi:hypothetical protein